MKKCAARVTLTILCAFPFWPALSATAKGADKGATPVMRDAAKPATAPRKRQQLNPAVTLATLMPEAAQIDLGIAVVPDPRVPRYRRPYDLGLVAIELGMLKNGYVLDRFNLPWNEALPDSSRPGPTGGNPPQTELQESDGQLQGPPPYGLMIFRCDAWRAHPTATPASDSGLPQSECESPSDQPQDETEKGHSRFRALYIVPDTSTSGIDAHTFQCVIGRIASQLSEGLVSKGTPVAQQPERPSCLPWRNLTIISEAAPPKVRLLTFPRACPGEFASALVVLGPTFSGSLDSLGALTERLSGTQTRISRICAVSGSASDSSNEEVVTRYPKLRYTSLALDNTRKIGHLAKLAAPLMRWLPGPRGDAVQEVRKMSSRIAILAEASTFGYGVCHDVPTGSSQDDPYRSYAKALCDSAVYMYFPANIADVRYGLLAARDAGAGDASPLNLKFPTSSDHLPLQLGTDNGSEFPESRQSGLTSVSAELALEQGLDALKSRSPVPEIVIVVATDVRDRLFLFDAVRSRLPGALLIDLGADNLLAHPDFLHASRGALALASAGLTVGQSLYGCESNATGESAPAGRQFIASWSIDAQAIYADAIVGLAATGHPGNMPSACPLDLANSQGSRQATIQVVTLEGFRKISNGYTGTGLARNATVGENIMGHLDTRRLELVESGAPLLCVMAAWLWISPLVIQRKSRDGLGKLWVVFANSFSYGICAVCASLLALGAYEIHGLDADNSLPLWLILIMVGGFSGLFWCTRILRRVSKAAPRTSYLNACAPTCLALSAALLACAPLWWLSTAQNTYGEVANVADLIQLAVDPDSGLALFLVVALATLTLLYASIVLSTGAGIVNRNSTVLRGAELQSFPARASADDAQNYDGRRGIPHLNPSGILVFAFVAIALAVLPDLIFGAVRLTIFGKSASYVALFALVATTASAALLACSAVGAAKRIAAISKYFCIAGAGASRGTAPQQSVAAPGLWPLGKHTPRAFPATPVVAFAANGGPPARQLLQSDALTQWTSLLNGWLYGKRDDSEHRLAVFTLLVAEISLYRWSVIGAVLCALASIAIVWLFPVEADRLMLLNLALLAGLGVTSGLVATGLERDELLTNILCNRKAKRRFSTPLFMFVALPFLAFALALAIANVPGVVDWGGGLLQLLSAMGVHP